MGNSSHEEERTLDYYCQAVDRNVGPCSIYTARHLPLCFVMKLRSRQHGIYPTMARVEDKQNRHLISLYGYVKVKNCDCEQLQFQDAVVSYWQYYNYYLEDLLKDRAQREATFREEEVWHLVKVCCEGYSSLAREGVLYDFRSSSIVVTTEGKLKLCWALIQEGNLHLPFLRGMAGRETLGYYSPEELALLRTKQRSLCIDLQKCNVFSFGMLLTHMLTLVDPQIFYNGFLLDLQAVLRLINKRLVGRVPTPLVELANACLQLQPAFRPSFTDIQSKWGSHFNDKYCVVLLNRQQQLLDDSRRSLGKHKISLRKQ